VVSFGRHQQVWRRLDAYRFRCIQGKRTHFASAARTEMGTIRCIRKPALKFEEKGVLSSHDAGLGGGNQHHTSVTWDNGISLLRAASNQVVEEPLAALGANSSNRSKRV
jgi:hypothetical protein